MTANRAPPLNSVIIVIIVILERIFNYEKCIDCLREHLKLPFLLGKGDGYMGGAKAEELLQFLETSGTIDLGDVEERMNKEKELRILQEHPYAVTQGKDGRWRTYVKADSGRKQIVKSTLEKLNRAIIEFYEENSEEGKLKRITLETLYPEWLEYKSLHTNASTYITRIESEWKRLYAGTEIVSVPIIELTKLKLDKWAHAVIKANDMTSKQYYNFSMIIRQVLDYAVDLDIIPSNPFSSVKVNGRMMFRQEKKPADMTQVYSREELEKLIELAKEDFEHRNSRSEQLAPLAVMFQFQTGLRVGELMAIRYEDIADNWESIHICRMYRKDTGEVVEHTKGSYGDRDVILTRTACDLIRMAKAKQAEIGVPTDGYIFSSKDTPLSYNSIRYCYQKYCRQLGIGTKSSHKARKTVISSLIDGGININTIRANVGHKDERTTYNNYCFDRRTNQEKVKQFESALAV